jgi:hypothetical protein
MERITAHFSTSLYSNERKDVVIGLDWSGLDWTGG